MRPDLQQFLSNVSNYFGKAISGVKITIGFLWSAITYVLFPEEAFKTALKAVAIVMFLDVITKWYAICRNNGGYKKAVKSKKLYSKSMWEGTSVKLFSYLVVSILAGLSYRVVFLEQASVFLATFIYSMLFLRDAQSCIENLIDAGADLGWLQLFVRGKQDKILKDEGIEKDEILKDEEIEENEGIGEDINNNNE